MYAHIRNCRWNKTLRLAKRPLISRILAEWSKIWKTRSATRWMKFISVKQRILWTDCDRCNPWPIRDNKLRSGRILQLRCRGEMPTIDLSSSRKASIMIMNRFYCIFDDPLTLFGIFRFFQTSLIFWEFIESSDS